MGEPPLLELYHIDAWLHNTKDMLLGQHLFHLLQLGPEHSRHNIWSVLQGLACKQSIMYLQPVLIASHRQEDFSLEYVAQVSAMSAHVHLLGSLMGVIYIT
jgi:hypothetical protein